MLALGILFTLFLMLIACWVPRDPNQCNFIGSIIGGALGFLGSRKNNKTQERLHSRDAYNNSPQGIRANAEEAGFNPLTVLTSGRQFGAGYSPTFENEGIHLGNAVQAGLTALDLQKLQVTQLKKQNHRLQTLVNNTTFDAKSPSVYERRAGNGRQDTDGNAEHGPFGDNFGTGNPGVRVLGEQVSEDKGFSDAEDVEQRYGDVLSSFYGAGVAIADGLQSYGETRLGQARLRLHNSLVDFYNPPERTTTTAARPRSRPTREQRIQHMRENFPTVFD